MNILDLTNVSVQVIVSIQSCPQGFFDFFGMENKRSARMMLILTLNGTFDI